MGRKGLLNALRFPANHIHYAVAAAIDIQRKDRTLRGVKRCILRPPAINTLNRVPVDNQIGLANLSEAHFGVAIRGKNLTGLQGLLDRPNVVLDFRRAQRPVIAIHVIQLSAKPRIE